MALSKKDKENITQFKKEIEELVAERRKANEYIDMIHQDEVFNMKGLFILDSYLDKIENKIKLKEIVFYWAHKLGENSDTIEPYILRGIQIIAGALSWHIATGQKIRI